MRRLISAAVHNSVAANLLMVVIIVVGGVSAYNLQRETFPHISFDIIQVQTIFPGATPEEVEESIVVKIEEAIKGVEGIQDIFSQALESSGVVLARVKPGVDNRRVLEDIQAEVEKDRHLSRRRRTAALRGALRAAQGHQHRHLRRPDRAHPEGSRRPRAGRPAGFRIHFAGAPDRHPGL